MLKHNHKNLTLLNFFMFFLIPLCVMNAILPYIYFFLNGILLQVVTQRLTMFYKKLFHLFVIVCEICYRFLSVFLHFFFFICVKGLKT